MHKIVLVLAVFLLGAGPVLAEDMRLISPDGCRVGPFEVGMSKDDLVSLAVRHFPNWTRRCIPPNPDGWPFYGFCVFKDSRGRPQLEFRYYSGKKTHVIYVLSPGFGTTEGLRVGLGFELLPEISPGRFHDVAGDGDAVEPAHATLSKYPGIKIYPVQDRFTWDDPAYRRLKNGALRSSTSLPLEEFNKRMSVKVTSLGLECASH